MQTKMIMSADRQKTDVGTWISDHVYVPVIGGVALIALIAVVICCCCRNRRSRKNYYAYKRLEYDVALAEQMERERQQRQDEVRDSAFLKCQFYLRSHPSYSNIVQLMDLGSRIDKHWFRVRDKKSQTDRMLNILPYNPKMVLPFTIGTAKTLKDLFSLLQHPYIFPMTDFDFALEQKYIIMVTPISMRGSLKDYIYQARFQDSWFHKYSQKRRGLNMAQVQLFGRQVLEALLYLEEKGYPAHGSIHSGNIMIHDGACRLAGYENAFLGNTSRMLPLIKKKLKDANKDAVDVLLFGHLLFEMAFGHELNAAHPGPQHLISAQSPAIVQVLNFIFENPSNKYPTLKEISSDAFFTQAQPVELQQYNPAPIVMSQSMKSVLKAVRKGKPLSRKRRSRYASKSSTPADFPPSSPTSPTVPGAPPAPAPPPAPGAPPPWLRPLPRPQHLGPHLPHPLPPWDPRGLVPPLVPPPAAAAGARC